jgi:thiazole tautomerase (transcriptional regulator TenI)
VFETASHSSAAGRGEEIIAELAWAVAAPIIAIGGIMPGNVATLRRAGAHGVAVIRGIWGEDDAGVAATDYLSKYDAYGDQ